MKISLCVISDTHLMSLPSLLENIEADFLIHCGDFTQTGSFEEIYKFKRQIHAIRDQFGMGIVMTPGNHDTMFQTMPLIKPQIEEELGVHILVEEAIEINGIRFWGSPYTPRTSARSVYQYNRGSAGPRWGAIPYGLDFLITHSPPGHILDESPSDGKIGCWDLRHEVMKKKPKHHLFGHVHLQGGKQIEVNGIKFYNCAVFHWGNNTFNGITEIEYEKEKSPAGGTV